MRIEEMHLILAEAQLMAGSPTGGGSDPVDPDPGFGD